MLLCASIQNRAPSDGETHSCSFHLSLLPPCLFRVRAQRASPATKLALRVHSTFCRQCMLRQQQGTNHVHDHLQDFVQDHIQDHMHHIQNHMQETKSSCVRSYHILHPRGAYQTRHRLCQTHAMTIIHKPPTMTHQLFLSKHPFCQAIHSARKLKHPHVDSTSTEVANCTFD